MATEYDLGSVIGPQGLQGIPGEKGEPGPTGPQGKQGAPGPTGATGAQGKQGIQGPPGEKGEKGEKGDKGEKGEKGDTGATGSQGPAGPRGADGKDGATGPQGKQGIQGLTGPQGKQGPTGPQGNPTTVNGKTGASITLAAVDIPVSTASGAESVSTALSKKAAASHDHSAANITSGTLSVVRGGTGNTTGLAPSATKLATARTIALSGGATGTATSFNGTANISIPVTALDPSKLSTVVPISKGGTGAASAAAARTALGAAAASHPHTIANVTGLETALSNKVNEPLAIWNEATDFNNIIPEPYKIKFWRIYNPKNNIPSGYIAEDCDFFVFAQADFDLLFVRQVACDVRSNAIWTRHSNSINGKRAWENWQKIAMAIPPQECTLPLAAGFITKDVASVYSKDQLGNVHVSFKVVTRNQTGIKPGNIHIATIPAGFRPSNSGAVHNVCSSANLFDGRFFPFYITGDGQIIVIVTEEIKAQEYCGFAGSITFVAA